MKKGITITSLVIYVVLFFGFTIITTSVSTNFNRNILQEKANININENILKIQSNLLNSSKKSTTITSSNNEIIFSNGDIYKLDKNRKVILKNEGVLCDFVSNLEILDNSEVTTNIIEDSKMIAINVTFEKFDITNSRKIVISAGDGLYE